MTQPALVWAADRYKGVHSDISRETELAHSSNPPVEHNSILNMCLCDLRVLYSNVKFSNREVLAESSAWDNKLVLFCFGQSFAIRATKFLCTDTAECCKFGFLSLQPAWGFWFGSIWRSLFNSRTLWNFVVVSIACFPCVVFTLGRKHSNFSST